MNSTLLGVLVGAAAVLALAFVAKWRMRNMPMTVAEKADYLGKKRARMLPALAVIFLSQQATFFAQVTDPQRVSAETVKVTAWLVLTIVLLLALSTKGFWFERKEVRDLLDDENTRANRDEAMRWGFLIAMSGAIGVYILAMIEPVTGRDAVHIVLSLGIAAALVRWGMLERRAHRDA
jgi:hypothetical protein